MRPKELSPKCYWSLSETHHDSSIGWDEQTSFFLASWSFQGALELMAAPALQSSLGWLSLGCWPWWEQGWHMQNKNWLPRPVFHGIENCPIPSSSSKFLPFEMEFFASQGVSSKFIQFGPSCKVQLWSWTLQWPIWIKNWKILHVHSSNPKVLAVQDDSHQAYRPSVPGYDPPLSLKKIDLEDPHCYEGTCVLASMGRSRRSHINRVLYDMILRRDLSIETSKNTYPVSR